MDAAVHIAGPAVDCAGADVPEGDGTDHFRTDQCLVGILRHLVDQGRDALVRLRGVGEAAVFGAERAFYLTGCAAPDFCAAKPSSYEILSLSRVTSQMAAHRVRPLEELLWEAGLYASRGLLMEGCSDQDVVRLAHWPNLTRLTLTPNTMRICALLQRRATSIMLAARLLKIEREEMFRFYSAASCAGIVTVLNRSAEVNLGADPDAALGADMPEERPNPRQRLLEMLFDKLRNA